MLINWVFSPQPADPWDGVRDALEVGSICPQYISGAAGDEDCLFVNVVTPLLPDNETTELKPVMVSIHGGGFTMGFGSLTWNGPYFFVEEDVIFVSMNYRLGALGFLSTGDSVIPGNNGLKDQTLALRWVQQNIAKFGGNPDNVTIFGISAGGCSVHHLVLSPLTKGLFHKAIAQSGSALNYWGYEEPDIARTKTEKFCEFLGNASTDSNEMAEFLRSLSIEEILVATEYLTGTQNNQLLSPNYFELTAERDVEEGEAVFLKDAPINTIISGNFNQVPFISGTVTHEGSIMFDAILWNSTALAIYDAYPELMVPIDLQIHLSPEEITALGKEIKQFYFGNEPITLDKLVQVTNLGTDFIILAGVDRHVSLHAEVSKAPVYQYLFSFNGRWGMVKSSRGDSFPAVGHGDDMDYFYYNSGLQYDFNSMEYTTLKRIVKMWTNFAKTGQLETVTLKIEQGEIRGKIDTTVNGLKYYSFLGIPYAKPPVGSLRFKSPQRAESWDGVHDALEEGAMCPQVSLDFLEYSGDEDCLFINVLTPELPKNGSMELKPVMAYIHGGGYIVGSGTLSVTRPDFFLEESLLVISMNYRLSALGFLSTGDSVIPGNYGLKDQVMALHWVQQNIAYFGGDPNSVTIFGISAGGTSVHHLVLSPAATGLFHKAIAQSGSALNTWGYEEPDTARDRTSKLCEVLGNSSSNSNEMAEFLLSLSARQITETTQFIYDQLDTSILEMPYFEMTSERNTEEGEMVFLEDTPINIIRSGMFNHVPFISGTVSHEGSTIFPEVLTNSSRLDYFNKHPEMLVPKDVKSHLSSEEIIAVGEKIKHFYFGNEPVSWKKLVQFINLGTDFVIQYGVDRHVRLHAAISKAPVYQYQLTFNGRWGTVKTSIGDSFPAVSHGDDASYIFYTTDTVSKYSDISPEYITLKRMVKMWTNFAKNGNPTPEKDSLLQNVTWIPATTLDSFYLDIGNDLVVKRDLENERLSFWEDIYTAIFR